MADNGNPPLLFEPLNDADDYTMVTCPINEEFSHIRDNEDEATKKTSEKTTTDTQELSEYSSSASEKTSEKILNFLRSNPKARRKRWPIISVYPSVLLSTNCAVSDRRGPYDEMGRLKAGNGL